MSTFSSSSASLCPASAFLKRYDIRSVADLLSRDGTRIGGTVPATATVEADVNLIAALKSGSGMLESACTKGGRYTVADLESLTGNSLELLYSIVSDLTMARLIQSRPDKRIPLPPAYQEALAWLDQLAEGERIFGIQEAMDAGRADHENEDAADVEARNLATYQADRFFGRRANRVE